MFGIFCPGPTELIIIAAIAMLLIGPAMLPKAARSLGAVIPSFKAGLKDAKDEVDDCAKELDKVVNGD
ncbi:MAG: twin-arginine translocase TatA/TatE family subunit [Deltaproteobacteria bacterium]|nr:twin-arginine translocase TatA/TatE family subunit [Deltaproteobacteria bacterium]